ncbi:DUF983 domain-containing protein [Rhizobium oryzicola]|uniref:DUF983 domain-containing protein n=1 Tax=Rhizobium oryzicola TaxID=1232668 RepID=A0ABT8SVD9_9HYPH|nr:DUF983 domain-containing protein [Rhizobium oryzicola]MDO1581858.1 DUF983 domain-containing protein [Rhizobium oryzicola]
MTGRPDAAVSKTSPVRYGGQDDAERPLGRSIKRGLLNRCPHCGEGRLFRAFLKPVDACAFCGEDMHHQRADDLPPYLVIFIIGHVTVGGYMMTDLVWNISMWAHLAIWVPITVLLAFGTIQPIKGGVIGLQWALRMHGFGGHDEDTDPGRGGPIE